MKFQPLLPLWFIIPYLIATLGGAGWLVWRTRRLGKAIMWRWIRRSIIVVMPVICALGPSIAGGASSPGISNLDVIFAVDLTPSMIATDYNGTQQRLIGAKTDLLALAGTLQGAHIEVIAFDSNASVILPSTTYASALYTAVNGMETQISSYSQGSQVDKPIDLILQELKNSKTANPQRMRLLYYLGDGEQTAGAPLSTFAPIAEYLDGGAVLGYGTAEGAKMIDTNGYDNTATGNIMALDPATGELVPAVSKANEATLKNIASQLKVTYQYRNQAGPLTATFQASKAPNLIDKSQHIVHYLNLYWLLAIPLAGVLFWEWQILLGKVFELQDRRGGKHV